MLICLNAEFSVISITLSSQEVIWLVVPGNFIEIWYVKSGGG